MIVPICLSTNYVLGCRGRDRIENGANSRAAFRRAVGRDLTRFLAEAGGVEDNAFSESATVAARIAATSLHISTAWIVAVS